MKMLSAIGCEYKIKDPNGGLHGDLEVAPAVTRAHPHGAITGFVHPYLEDLGVGAIAYIPTNVYGNRAVSLAAIQYMLKHHGTGSFKTNYDKDNQIVELIRYS